MATDKTTLSGTINETGMGQTLKGNADIFFIVRSLGGNNFWLSQFLYEKLLSRNTTLFDFTATIEIQQYKKDYLTNIWDV